LLKLGCIISVKLEYLIETNSDMDDRIEEFLISHGVEYSSKNQEQLDIECDIPAY